MTPATQTSGVGRNQDKVAPAPLWLFPWPLTSDGRAVGCVLQRTQPSLLLTGALCLVAMGAVSQRNQITRGEKSLGKKETAHLEPKDVINKAQMFSPKLQPSLALFLFFIPHVPRMPHPTMPVPLSVLKHTRLKDMLFQLKPHRSQLAPVPVGTLGGELEIHLGLTQCNLSRWKRNPDTEYCFSRRNILNPVNHHIISFLGCVFHKTNIGRQNFCIYTCFCQQKCSLFRFSTAISLKCRILNFTEEKSFMSFCFKVLDSKYM